MFKSRVFLQNIIPLLRLLPKLSRHSLHLVFHTPRKDLVEISTLMTDGIEIGIWLWVIFEAHVREEGDVCGAHEFLTEDVETVSC